MDELPDPRTFLSGTRGEVRGARRLARRTLDAALDVALRPALRRVDRLATPRRTVVVASIYRPGGGLLAEALDRLTSERHDVRLAFGATEAAEPALAPQTVATELGGGKFPNLNAVLAGADPDWLVVVDDDVRLPPRFLDRFVALCEHFGLELAQPAQTLASHAAWERQRRRPLSLVRETRFVEIGPVTALARAAQAALLPFPDLRYGWGLDLAWGALAREHGWRVGVVDATAVRHEQAAVAAAYSSQAAIEEARRFLAGRRFLTATEAAETLASHRRL